MAHMHARLPSAVPQMTAAEPCVAHSTAASTKFVTSQQHSAPKGGHPWSSWPRSGTLMLPLSSDDVQSDRACQPHPVFPVSLLSLGCPCFRGHSISCASSLRLSIKLPAPTALNKSMSCPRQATKDNKRDPRQSRPMPCEDRRRLTV